MPSISIHFLLNPPALETSHQDLTKIWLDLHMLYENFHVPTDSLKCGVTLENALIALLKINPQNSFKHSEKHLFKNIFLLAEALKRKVASPRASQHYIATSRKRRNFDSITQAHLERWFCSNYQYPYPNKVQIASLSKSTDLSNKQIKNWMSNRRRKARKEVIDNKLKPLLNS